MDYSRGPEKTWVYGALHVRDGKELTRRASSRNSTNYIELLKDIEADNAIGDIYIITDNLSSHNSAQTRVWLVEHPRLQQVFISIDFFMLLHDRVRCPSPDHGAAWESSASLIN